MSFLWQHFINSVPGIFCSFGPSTVSSSGIPSSIKNVFSACPTSDFLSIVYISAKYVPLENTYAYRFPYNDFTSPSMVSVPHIVVSLLLWNALSALYCSARGITTEQVSLCTVLEISLLLDWYLSDTSHSVFQVTRLNDVPSIGMSLPVTHLVPSLFSFLHLDFKDEISRCIFWFTFFLDLIYSSLICFFL